MAVVARETPGRRKANGASFWNVLNRELRPDKAACLQLTKLFASTMRRFGIPMIYFYKLDRFRQTTLLRLQCDETLKNSLCLFG